MIFSPCGIFATDCKKLSKYESFNQSDAVFIGEIINVQEANFTIRTYEFFKGKELDTLVAIIDANSIVPILGDVWLFYAHSSGDSLHINICSGSKNFRNPFNINDLSSPEHPPSNFRDPSMLYLLESLLKSEALDELYFEIQWLYSLKSNGQIRMLQQDRQADSQYEDLKNDLAIAKWLLVVLIFFNLGALLIIFLKR